MPSYKIKLSFLSGKNEKMQLLEAKTHTKDAENIPGAIELARI